MKTLFPILCFTLIIMSCTKDDSLQNTNGTKLHTIEYNDGNRTIDQWQELFSYNDNGVLNKIEDLYSLGRRYEIKYENNQLLEYSTYTIDDNKIAFRDSVAYNPNGTIKAIYNFSINSGLDLPLSWIYEFNYSSQNKLTEKKTFFVGQNEYTSNEKYYWNEDNIERVEYYKDEFLLYEYFYTYDNKINYKKNLSIYISDPVNWSENNVTEVNWNDYLGNLDLICRPCKTKYKYNLDNYPVFIEYNWGRKLNLTYE